MTSDICPKFAKCPIFQKNVFVKEGMDETYKKLYCTAGKVKYDTCKRYIVSELTGGKPIPEKIRPNCSLTIKEILATMK